MAEYAMPNWIRPPDIAEQYARGLQLGQQAASEQQRLQFQQIQAERDHMLETQRMQITKAYQDQQIQLRQQELKQEQDKINIQTQDAARRLDAYQKFQSAVQGGEDTVGAALKYLPGAGESLGGVGTLAAAFEREKRMRGAVGEPEVKSYGGKQFLVVPGEYGQRPQFHPVGQDPEQRMVRMRQLAALQREKATLEKAQESDLLGASASSRTDQSKMSDLAKAWAKAYDDRKKRIKDLQLQLDEAYSESGGLPPTDEEAPSTQSKRFKFNVKTGKIEPVQQEE
jgi:hypothetical protein